MCRTLKIMRRFFYEIISENGKKMKEEKLVQHIYLLDVEIKQLIIFMKMN